MHLVPKLRVSSTSMLATGKLRVRRTYKESLGTPPALHGPIGDKWGERASFKWKPGLIGLTATDLLIGPKLCVASSEP